MNDDDETRIESRSGVPPTGESTPRAVRVAGGNALPAGFHLAEFRIEQVIGEGGFGIVYLAHDTQLHRSVAVKEYMPSALASRGSDLSIAIRSERQRETFEAGMRSFINEARLLALFDHPALVKVYRFWEEHGTAYMVMPHYVGPTLKDWRRREDKPPSERWLRALIASLLDALELLHSRNCYHRDIAPDNILLLQDDAPLLLDFGAARRIIGDMTQALTVILKPGYAPAEQYADVAAMRQGPWTDLYALSAVVYFLVSGEPPPAAVGRLMSEEIVPATQVGGAWYSLELLRAIDAGLAVRPEDRPQDVATFRNLIFGSEQPPDAEEDRTIMDLSPRAATIRTAQPTRPKSNSVFPSMMGVTAPQTPDKRTAHTLQAGARFPPKARVRLWVAGVAASAVVLGFAFLVSRSYLGTQSPEDKSTSKSSAAPAAVSSPESVPGSAVPTRSSNSTGAGAVGGATKSATTGSTTERGTGKAQRRSDADRRCADLLQRLSLGEDTPALREQLQTTNCPPQ